jgi:alpha-methylacyl-CoA racemase
VTAGGPLSGVRVIELAGIGPAPFAAMVLADLGAEVLRIDRPPRPDPTGVAPAAPATAILNRGRRSAILDLRTPAARDTVLRLASRADVLIEGLRPGVAERLGVGPEPCLARRPALVYARMTGWGQTGPLAGRAGHDINYVALSGALHAIGGPAAPAIPVNLLGDFGAGGMLLVVGVLAALTEARGSGRGQVVDAAIVDGASLLTAMLHGLLADGRWRDERAVNLLDGGAPWYDLYETADGGHMAVGALEPQFFAELMNRLGIDPSGVDRDDPADRAELRRALAARFRRRTRDEWTEHFAGTDACVTPVLSLKEAADHSHLAARETFVSVAGVRQPAPAPRFDRTPAAVPAAPARPGAHTREALRDWGVDGVDQLIAAGAAIQT